MEIKFKDKDHELNYLSLFQEMKKQTSAHQAVAYLLALDPICFLHCRELYDFREGHTIPRGLDEAWHTLISIFGRVTQFQEDLMKRGTP